VTAPSTRRIPRAARRKSARFFRWSTWAFSLGRATVSRSGGVPGPPGSI